MGTHTLDAVRMTADASILEALMEQAKLDALIDAVVASQRRMREAGEKWRAAKARLDAVPKVPSEKEFSAEMREGLNPFDPRPLATVRSYVKDWAKHTADFRDAQTALEGAEGDLGEVTKSAHDDIEMLVKIFQQNNQTG
jgi:hypothetical protein